MGTGKGVRREEVLRVERKLEGVQGWLKDETSSGTMPVVLRASPVVGTEMLSSSPEGTKGC